MHSSTHTVCSALSCYVQHHKAWVNIIYEFIVDNDNHKCKQSGGAQIIVVHHISYVYVRRSTHTLKMYIYVRCVQLCSLSIACTTYPVTFTILHTRIYTYHTHLTWPHVRPYPLHWWPHIGTGRHRLFGHVIYSSDLLRHRMHLQTVRLRNDALMTHP